MKRLTILAIAGAVSACTAAAFAQYPAGTPESQRGSSSSNSGNPAPQQELETHRDHKGRLVTEDELPVETMREGDNPAHAPDRHSGPGGPTDPSSDPDALE